jgi:glycosyl transferase family 4
VTASLGVGHPLRVLHLGSGFRPLRWGGVVAYVEDLMEEQARRGHELSYFFSGRHFPYVRRPRLRRRRRATGGVLFEVISSPLYDHGRQPELELSEPRIERMLERVIQEVDPDVVHVQELVGLPSSVLDVARRAGVPTIVALHDYFRCVRRSGCSTRTDASAFGAR